MKYLPKEKMYSLPVSNKTIGTFKDGSSVKGYDWLNYIKQYKTDYQQYKGCLLYTSDAADDLLCVDLGGRRIIKKKTKTQ